MTFENPRAQVSLNSFDSLVIYVREKYIFKYAEFISFKGNIIWSCAVGPIMCVTQGSHRVC